MILLLVGHKQAGKDTFADELVRSQGFRRVAFGDEVKKEILKAFVNYDHIINYELVNYLFQPELKEIPLPFIGITPRALMQNWGTWRRLDNENYWVASTIVKCNELLRQNPNEKLVITDCRYKNEVDAFNLIYSQHFPDHIYTVKITREGCNGDSHHSEDLARDETVHIDYTLKNDGSLEEFQKVAREFIGFITRVKDDQREDPQSVGVGEDTYREG